MRCTRSALAIAAAALLAGIPVEAKSADVLTLDAYKARVCGGETYPSGCRSQVDDLDRKLNAVFREAIRVTPAKTKLRAEQRKWLAEVRDRASVLRDAKAAHMSRILELHEIALGAIGRLELPLEKAEQKEICEGIAGSASRGELADLMLEARDMPVAHLTANEEAKARESAGTNGGDPSNFFALHVRRGQRFPFAYVFAGGSCFSAEIRRAALPLEDSATSWPSEKIDEEDDVLRWAGWGNGESVLMFGGRYFFVAGSSSSPEIVTWVTPIGTRRPICALEVERVERSVNFAREDASMCAAAARDELPIIKWKTKPYGEMKWTEDERNLLLEKGLRGAGLPLVDVTTVDINSDGVPDTLARGQYDSGAGCGGALSRLMLLTDGGEHLKSGPTNDVVMDLSTYNTKPVEVLSHRSRTYVRAALEGKPALFQMTPDALHTECVFHDQPISRVRTLYPLDGVLRNPAGQAPR